MRVDLEQTTFCRGITANGMCRTERVCVGVGLGKITEKSSIITDY